MRLRADQKWALASAAGVLIAVRVTLAFVRFSSVARWAKTRASRPVRGLEIQHADVVVWAIESIARRIPGTTCLCRALAAQRLLGAKGIETRLRLGVARIENRLQAHAWLEGSRGIVSGIGAALDYAPLPEFEFEAR